MTEHSSDEFAADELRWAVLMANAQAGNEADYRLLLTEISTVIQRYLNSRFGQYHFLEDCVQDTLLAIHQARHTYNPRSLFRPWMFAIVRHKAIDAFRRQRSHHNTVERHREDIMLNAQTSNGGQMERQIVQGRLMQALSPEYRDALTLTKIHGLTISEAAAELSISEGTLKVRVHRAVGRLKRMVEADVL